MPISVSVKYDEVCIFSWKVLAMSNNSLVCCQNFSAVYSCVKNNFLSVEVNLKLLDVRFLGGRHTGSKTSADFRPLLSSALEFNACSGIFKGVG